MQHLLLSKTTIGMRTRTMLRCKYLTSLVGYDLNPRSPFFLFQRQRLVSIVQATFLTYLASMPAHSDTNKESNDATASQNGYLCSFTIIQYMYVPPSKSLTSAPPPPPRRRAGIAARPQNIQPSTYLTTSFPRTQPPPPHPSSSMEQISSWEAKMSTASQKFTAFYGTRKLITAFTAANHLSLSCSISSHPRPHLISLRSVLILPSQLCLGLLSGLFHWFPHQTTACTPSPTCSAHPHSSSVDHSKNIRWIQIIKLLVMYFSLLPLSRSS
jgi:hypothetical protein